MSSVTGRIKEIKQPHGGYLKSSLFKKIDLNDDRELNEKENIHASIIGLTVDYMTRFLMGTEINEAFKISIVGARIAEKLTGNKSTNEINKYLSKIKKLDSKSIINACKAVTYDVWYRNTGAAILATTAEDINPNKETIENIEILIKRSLAFFEKYGPITVDGFDFGEKGYTKTVDAGDGDFLTKDTLWDFKVSVSSPNSKHTLQLLMYYIMGLHSEKDEFKNIKKIGIFNPRLNKIYICDISDIPCETIETIEKDVICY